MNVKSRFDTEDEDRANARPSSSSEGRGDSQRSQYMRGMCSTPLAMIAEASRLDVSEVHAPNFIQKIFRAIGWKTRSEK
jgi:hypothetical protein